MFFKKTYFFFHLSESLWWTHRIAISSWFFIIRMIKLLRSCWYILLLWSSPLRKTKFWRISSNGVYLWIILIEIVSWTDLFLLLLYFSTHVPSVSFSIWAGYLIISRSRLLAWSHWFAFKLYTKRRSSFFLFIQISWRIVATRRKIILILIRILIYVISIFRRTKFSPHFSFSIWYVIRSRTSIVDFFIFTMIFSSKFKLKSLFIPRFRIILPRS